MRSLIGERADVAGLNVRVRETGVCVFEGGSILDVVRIQSV